jgi:transcriptional regulator with XRE-family HTH domain
MITEELKALGQNIRTLRRSLKLSQEAFAETCDLHRTYVCDIERGARNVSFCSLLKIAHGLGTTISEITRNVDINFSKAEIQYRKSCVIRVLRNGSPLVAPR